MLVGIILFLVGVAALSHTAPFPFVLDLARRDISVWRLSTAPDEKIIYLTFDDGPNPTATPDLLDVLKDKNVHATFFLIPRWVSDDTAAIVLRIFEEGHTVALHSGDRWLMMHSPDDLARTLQEAADQIESLTGRRPCPIFRPHGGWRSVRMLRGISRLNYKLVGWSWMSWDWCWFRKRTGRRVASQVIGHAAPGKIIVIHDGDHINPRADRRYAIEAAERIIDALGAQGYQFGTLCHIVD